jgi:hypothetical protein
VAKSRSTDEKGEQGRPQEQAIDVGEQHETSGLKQSRGPIELSDKLHQYFLDQPAQLTEAQVHELETRFIEEEGVIRRTALASLARSGREMHLSCTRSEEAARAFALMSANIERYVGRLEVFIKLMNTANARVLLALYGRPDRERLLRDAKNAKLN